MELKGKNKIAFICKNYEEKECPSFNTCLYQECKKFKPELRFKALFEALYGEVFETQISQKNLDLMAELLTVSEPEATVIHEYLCFAKVLTTPKPIKRSVAKKALEDLEDFAQEKGLEGLKEFKETFLKTVED